MRRIAAILWDATRRFVEDDGFSVSSHMTLAALTSLFPFLIFITALAGFFGSAGLANEATRLVFDAWPADVAGPISQEVRNVLTAPRGGLLTLSAALSLYFSTSAVEALRTGLNRAYGFTERRSWWWLRLASLAYLLLGAAALLSLAFLLVLGPTIWAWAAEAAPAIAPLRGYADLVRLGVATLLLAGATLAAHLGLPAGHLRIRDVVPGVLATLIVSVVFSEAFGAYLREYAARYVSTYAGLASVMVALLFLNSLSTIFLGGGALNAAIMRSREASRRSRP
jgi:membrane protein